MTEAPLLRTVIFLLKLSTFEYMCLFNVFTECTPVIVVVCYLFPPSCKRGSSQQIYNVTSFCYCTLIYAIIRIVDLLLHTNLKIFLECILDYKFILFYFICTFFLLIYSLILYLFPDYSTIIIIVFKLVQLEYNHILLFIVIFIFIPLFPCTPSHSIIPIAPATLIHSILYYLSISFALKFI